MFTVVAGSDTGINAPSRLVAAMSATTAEIYSLLLLWAFLMIFIVIRTPVHICYGHVRRS